MSSSLPNSSELSKPCYSSPRVHEYIVVSTNGTKDVRPGAVSVGRNDPGDYSISRTKSSPMNLRLAKNVGGFPSQSNPEDGGHVWNSRSPSVTSRSSYSPPTEDDSDFEMDEQSALSHTFDSSGKKEESEGKVPKWDGLEMEMEM